MLTYRAMARGGFPGKKQGSSASEGPSFLEVTRFRPL
jgi:hypothetical protein